MPPAPATKATGEGLETPGATWQGDGEPARDPSGRMNRRPHDHPSPAQVASPTQGTASTAPRSRLEQRASGFDNPHRPGSWPGSPRPGRLSPRALEPRMINVGDDAPDFLVRSTLDRSIWLRSMRGRPVVLHFFPKPLSPGDFGSIERFGESYAEIRSCGAEVIGIVLDDLEPREGGPPPPKVRFPLVSDHSTQIARTYGVFRRLASANAERPISFGLSEAGIVEMVFELDPAADQPSSEVVKWLRSRVPVDHETVPPRASRLPGEIIAERYQLKRRLAEGGIGVVWVAEHLELRQEVAIKLLKESTRADPDHAIHVLERFRHEAQVSALLGKRTLHVVQAQDAGFSEVGPYLVMELIDGSTLR